MDIYQLPIIYTCTTCYNSKNSTCGQVDIGEWELIRLGHINKPMLYVDPRHRGRRTHNDAIGPVTNEQAYNPPTQNKNTYMFNL